MIFSTNSELEVVVCIRSKWYKYSSEKTKNLHIEVILSDVAVTSFSDLKSKFYFEKK